MAKFESSDERSKCSAFEEMDVSCRYGRYADVLGRGAIKIVYHAFDYREGIEVAWNKVSLMQCLNHYCMQRLYSEVSLLASLSHENILMFYDAWLDRNTKSINFITEFCPSGTLRQYRQKHKHVSMHALKNWACQILKGLNYLHSCNPPIIHRDLNCSNIFVEGNSGILKIGDLGLSCVLGRDGFAHSVVGTPEFMAPELYEENYDELVDIYSFGMCMLEMVTIEIPYSECSNVAQIYKKVACGGMPAALGKVVDPQVRQLIEKCLAPRMVRPSAAELMMDPVFNEVHLI